MIVSSNGRIGWNSEHAATDAIVMGRMIDFVYLNEKPPLQKASYTQIASKLPSPVTLLKFSVDDVITASLNEAPARALALKSSSDIRIKASPFGKAVMKKLGVSPDGFIQMALQLAWANDQHGRQHIFPHTCDARVCVVDQPFAHC
jgi:carnitine O-acetyltransferase